MAIRYKFIERPKSVEVGAELFEKQIFPMLNECWNARGEPFYKQSFLFNVRAFLDLWVMNGLVCVIAYDEDKAVGILVGIKFSPMMFSRSILQIETCYSKQPDIEKGLIEYLDSLAAVLNYDEIWVQGDVNVVDPKAVGYKELRSYSVRRYSRE